MKKTLTLLVVASVGFLAVGCDPAPKDEPNAATSGGPGLSAKSAAKPSTAKTAP